MELSVENGSPGDIDYVSLSQESKRRYLNYAMSVITSRALPDIRDGLKPVQRRILYTMFEERLLPDAKFRKCAKICGDTTGNLHPHSPEAVYEALVRMAQDFTLRYPLVDGQGNFGSIMGLPAAANRYTEARLRRLAAEMMEELRADTVEMRPNYDATREEPVVLPARYPNLLVNGSQGIAVGMATNMPPHNLGEVIRACLALIDSPELTTAQLLKYIKGPDFPLGGRIVTDRATLKQIYEEGRGPIKVRGEWRFDVEKRKEVSDRIVIYTIPYGVETGPLMTELNAIVSSRKIPQLLEVSDQSDGENGIRIVLGLKSGADPETVMAYLYKHTQLEQNFAYNSTCLVPDHSGMLVPARVNIAQMLEQFLKFRFETVRRRFSYELAQLERRIHILTGFQIIFNGLDRALKLIRGSQGKADASQKLRKEFPLDEVQTDAILELALYRISNLEIDKILEELREKELAAGKIRTILASERRLWGVIKTELTEIGDQYGDKRRTSLGSSEELTEFDPQAYIVRENTNVVLTKDGWVKRVGRLGSVESTRVREGDEVIAVIPASTTDHVIFFAQDGIAYTLAVDQIPASSGYGEPLSKHIKLADGVNILTGITTDPRFTPSDEPIAGEEATSPLLLVATGGGQILRVSLAPFRLPSTKAGRRYCKLVEGDRVILVEMQHLEAKSLFLASKKSRVIHFSIDEIPILSGAGKGARGMKLEAGDQILGYSQMTRPSDCLRVETTADKGLTLGQVKYEMTSRGGKGHRVSSRSEFTKVVVPPIELVDWTKIEEK